jgi:hypothetical protein
MFRQSADRLDAKSRELTMSDLENSSPIPPPLDNPIKTSKEDALGRASVAHDLALSIRNLDASEGVVAAVLGPWGNGKSSFVNLMREQFAEDPALTVIDFNPWVFSGTRSLTDVFFTEIAAELRLKDGNKFDAIAEGLDEYGDVLSPLAIIPGFGNWWDRATKSARTFAAWWSKRRKGSTTFRDQVAKALLGLDEPIVVVIDDIDRLTTAEIRDIFKLVRLTARFPKIVYLLAFDRVRVESALQETGVPGRAYLEKIVQVGFDLPVVPSELLRSRVFAELNRVMDSVPELRFDANRWADVYYEVIEPLLFNLRDVTRFAISARPNIVALGSDIETVDLLALEAIRVFRPEMFVALQAAKQALTEPTRDYGGTANAAHQSAIDTLLQSSKETPGVARSLIRRVFPAGRRYVENNSYGTDWLNTWKRAHVVAHIDYLNYYLQRTAPADLLAFRHAENLVTLLDDLEAADTYLDLVDPIQLEDVIDSLGAYRGEFAEQAVVPGTIALMNRISKIPRRQSRGITDLNRPDWIVSRIVYRLFEMLDGPEREPEREAAVREILPRLTTLSSKLDLLDLVGYTEGSGHKLISESVFADLTAEVLASVASTFAVALDDEWALIRVLYRANQAQPGLFPMTISDPRTALALFVASKGWSRSQSMDSRSAKVEEVLAWDALTEIMGSEEAIGTAVDLVRDDATNSDLVNLVDKYLGGWRPRDL